MQFATIKGLRIEKYTLQSQNWRESAKTNKTTRLITARRNKIIKEKKLCPRCFGNHGATACLRHRMKCLKCEQGHNTLLHFGNPEIAFKDETPKATKEASTNKIRRRDTAMRIVPIYLYKKDGAEGVRVNAMLDDCSDCSYITKDIAQKLNLKGRPEKLLVEVIGGKIVEEETETVKAEIESTDRKITLPCELSTIKEISSMSPVNWNEEKKKYEHLKEIQFPDIETNGKVEMLLGSDMLQCQRALEERVGGQDDPIARRTPLGWTCVHHEMKGKKKVTRLSQRQH
jgi:hypothetical protein